MSKKFCPLGMFSFYVNKSQAQAGACHHCVEEECALWNEDYGDCGIKVGLDSIASLAEQFTGGHVPEKPPVRHLEFESPKLSIFDKLRKKLPTAEPAPVVAQPAPTTPSPVIPSPTVEAPSSTAQIVLSANTDDLLKPPNIPVDALPIISSQEK